MSEKPPQTAPAYWLTLFSGVTWQEFVYAGAEVVGFGPRKGNQIRRIKHGDYLLCYLTRVKAFAGVLEVVGEPFRDDTASIWSENFPWRIQVRPITLLTAETAVPIEDLTDRLSLFSDPAKPHAWSGQVRSSPTRWKVQDGKVIVEAVARAFHEPNPREILPYLLRPYPRRVPSERSRKTKG